MKTGYFLMFLLFFSCLPFSGKSQDSKGKGEELSVEITKKDASGENSSDGFIHIKVSGGEAPYSINLFSTTVKADKAKDRELKLNNLKPGTYLFIVQDNAKTIKRETVEISVRK